MTAEDEKREFFPSREGTSRLSFRPATLAKVCFTFALLGFVYSHLDIPALIERLTSLEPASVLVIICLYFLGQVVSSFKWRVFLMEAGIMIPHARLLRAFFLGMFVNTFGLGTVGGDVARAMAIPCPSGFRGAVLATVLADRIHGLITLLLIGSVALLLLRPPYVPELVLIGLVFLVLGLFSAWIFGPRIVLFVVPSGSRLWDKLERAFKAFPRRPSALFLATLISVTFHSIQICMAYKIFEAIKSPISLKLAYATIPFINGISALPITVNGLGVREAISIYILQPAGVSSESSVAFAALWIVVVSLVSAIGGLLVIPFFGEGRIGWFRQDKKEQPTY